MGPVRRHARALVLLLAGWHGAGAVAWAAEPIEYAVKAAYLAKFPFYVEWPPGAFAAPASPVVLCIVGDDPFGQAIDEAVAGQQVQGRPITVRRMKTIARDSGCHIAYVGADTRAEALRGGTVLVVSDGPNGSGIINFVLRDNKVRFTVDDEAAFQNGLSISSKLLSVALSVRARGTR
jgi:hypothetical protein